ncbi:MAG: FtsX-like permease family protein [Phycisphaerae bacterium]
MYKFILAARYLFKRRISYLAISAVALSVFVVLVVITVLNGISENFKGYIHQSIGDCVIHSKSLVGFGYYDEFLEELERQPYVAAASPVIKNYALISVRDSGGLSVYGDFTKEIIGIEPVSYSRVTGFSEWLGYNRENPQMVFRPWYDPNLPGCVPGIGFLFTRDKMGAYNTADSASPAAFEINCIPLTARGALARAGAGEFSSKTFYYSDHFQAGYSIDWRLFYIPFEDAQLLSGMGIGHKRISAIHIKFTPQTDLQAGCDKIKTLWNDFINTKSDAPYFNLLERASVQSWKEYSRMMVALVETQQTLMIFCFAMIGLIIVSIIFVVFDMIISHKSKDIGILKSIGTSNFSVISIFMLFALFISIAGSAIGTLAGWRFLVHINEIERWVFENFEFQLWDRSISSMGDIPNTMNFNSLLIILICSAGVCMLGALLPSFKASRAKCVDTLQVAQL